MYIHKLDAGWFQHPFWRRSFLLEREQDLQIIRANPIDAVWIDLSKSWAQPVAVDEEDLTRRRDEPEVVTEPLSEPEQTVPKTVRSAGVSLHEEIQRAKVICKEAGSQVKAMFEEARMGRAIDPQYVQPLLQDIAASVDRHPQALISVARLKTQDSYTYMHCVAVCGLMLALSRQLRLTPEMTEQAGLGGLMHDLGKASVPNEILNKPSRLTESEFSVMKNHPALGAEMLKESGADLDVLDVVLHHHEKMDGTGYPHRLAGSFIPFLARMAAVCDVYDAVTSVRPYMTPWNPAQAMQRMAAWKGHFDQRIFEAFVKTVGIYPVGSLVRLRSDRLAVVRAQEEASLLTPQVVAFFNLKSGTRIKEETLNLYDPQCGDAISEPENADHWQFENLDDYWMSAAYDNAVDVG